MSLTRLFEVRLPIIAPVVLLPLPGSPRYAGSMGPVIERALGDMAALASGGVDGFSFENYGDVPLFKTEAPPETVAGFAAVLAEARRATKLPFGVNVLRNCSRASLALAHALGGGFIRVNVLTEAYVTDQGIVEGTAAELMRTRRLIGAGDVLVFADIHVKHAMAMLNRPLEDSALDAVERGLADVLVVTGGRSGEPPDVSELMRVHAIAETVIGSGLTAENAPQLLAHADGAIVASYFRQRNDLAIAPDTERVVRLMEAVHSLRDK